MTHPSSLDLEAFAVGEPLPVHLAGHVEECSECGAFLERLRIVMSRVSSGPSAIDADDAVARALARMTESEAFVDPLEPATPATPATPREAPHEPKRKLWLLASSVIAPLAAAAAILLLTRSPAPPPLPQADFDTREPTNYKIQMGTIPPGVVIPNASGGSGASGATEPDTQFKGGMQVAVVRDRGGAQARFSSTVRVRPGDRLRVEVALDHEQAILGAVLADDGTYLELMPQAVRGPGTHFSERSAKIDAAPTRGTIIIGSPAAIAHARETKSLDGVTTLRVELESP
ncbi:MAG: hypothetical protein JWO86_911 [Myxococcaceae bacterium]|nr:hypothetical protein [Myxococcaceae bacterium]